MDPGCRKNYEYSKGFTISELLITIAVLMVLGIGGVTVFFGFRNNNELRLAGEEVESMLRTTQVKAASQENGTAWGVYFDNVPSSGPAVSVFKGTTYSPENVVSTKHLGASLVFLDPANGTTEEIAFRNLKGSLISGSEQTIVLALKTNVNSKVTITVYPNGRVKKIAN